MSSALAFAKSLKSRVRRRALFTLSPLDGFALHSRFSPFASLWHAISPLGGVVTVSSLLVLFRLLLVLPVYSVIRGPF